MKLLNSTAYHITRFAFFIFGLVNLMNAIFLTVHIVRPYEPVVKLPNGWVTGYTDYMKGIPLHMVSLVKVPDSSFTWENFAPEDNLMQSGQSIAMYGLKRNPSTEESRILVAGSKYGYSDTVIAGFHSTDYQIPDPTIRAATIDGFTFYIWPELLSRRLLLFLPVLLLYLACVICSWLLLRFMKDIKTGNDLRRKSYRKLTWIGLTIIVVQLVLFYLGTQEEFRRSYSIKIHSSIPNYHTPLDISGSPESPSSPEWVFVGLAILGISRTVKKGKQMRNDSELAV